MPYRNGSYEALKEQLETFKNCSLELIDTQNTQYHEPVETASKETTPGNRGVTSSQSSRGMIGWAHTGSSSGQVGQV